MLKKSITYEDLEGNSVTEVFYFNYTMSELIEMQNSVQGGLENVLKRMVESDNHPEILQQFKKIVLGAYGVKSQDGKRFVKTPERALEFSQTFAYDVLFLELISNHNTMADFINGIMPKNFQQKVEQMTKAQAAQAPAVPQAPPVPPATQ